MAQNNNIEGWSFVAFAKAHKETGKMRVIKFNQVNQETGEVEYFSKLCWVDPAKLDDKGRPQVNLYVGFSKALGELTADQVKERRNELRVIKQENGIYKLVSIAGEAVDDSWLDQE